MNIERPILNVLDANPAERMISAEAIAQFLPVGIEPTAGDVRRVLRLLEAKNQVVGVTTDDGVLWQITSNGRARLA